MQKTLESFIDPINIPKKYGGQLEFTFGDLPVFDPAISKIIKWEGETKDFPHGPMYWRNTQGERVEGKLGEETREMTALAVGSVEGNQRDDTVCTVTRTLGTDEDVDGLTNGHTTAGTAAANLEKAQTATEDSSERPTNLLVPTKSQLEAPTQPTTPMHEVQEGELVPATRPEPKRFVTANEDLSGLAKKVEGVELSEKSGNLNGNGVATNGNGPHVTAAANLLDPAVKVEGK